MGSRKWIAGLLVVGGALLVVPFAGGTSAVSAAPTDMTFKAILSEANEHPPTGSAGTGTVTVVLDGAETTITVSGSFSGLGSPSTVAHIHGPAPTTGDAPPIFTLAFTAGSTSGTFPSQMFTVTSTQATELKTGMHYVNVHSEGFGGGEIRGQLLEVTTAVRITHASATRTPQGVLVRWRTASEAQTLGFNVYRLHRGKLAKANRALIRSVFGPTTSHAYSWFDRNAPSRRTSYRLQAVRLDGTRAWVASASA